MAFPYKRILCPVDFDVNSLSALEEAALLTRQSEATLYLLHVAPIVIKSGLAFYADVNQAQLDYAKTRLTELARKQLAGLKHELIVPTGQPAEGILQAAAQVRADLIVMATHGRRGLAHFFMGSVVESVLRKVECPVLAVRGHAAEKDAVVGAWMTHNPVTVAPGDKLTSVQARMEEGEFRSLPVMDNGQLVGIITNRDLKLWVGRLADSEVRQAMTQGPVTVTRDTTLQEAARLLEERKIGGLPVIEDGQLVGIVTTSDILEALQS
jgi:nucleotide-binding universal stress UspA family protein